MVEIRKASRKKARLRLGIAAPSGAGKTLGSLMLAYGITGNWDKIALIDTEEGSGELYVGVKKHGVEIGEFLYSRISGSFAPVHYIEHIHAMEKAGAEVIIIDSATHAWSGVDGLLDKQGKIAAKTGNSYTAWKDITPQHNALVNALLQSPAHIIVTMRSKVEYALQKGSDDKFKVTKMGMAPIQREGMEYEFTVFFDIDANSRASASKDRTDLFSEINAAGSLDKKDFIITPKTGEQLLGWLESGKEAEPTEREKLIKQILAKVENVTSWQESNNQDAYILQNKHILSTLDDDRLGKINDYLTNEKGV